MKKRILICIPVIILGLAVWPTISTRAQETPKSSTESKPAAQTRPQDVYRLDFVVREMDGSKTINSRSYMISVEDGRLGKVRAGSNVPVQTAENSFMDNNVDVNIDCRLFEREGGVLLDSSFDSSSYLADQWTAGKPTHPIRRGVRFEGQSLVTLGKPTIIGKLDDVATNHRFEIEVTATKVK